MNLLRQHQAAIELQSRRPESALCLCISTRGASNFARGSFALKSKGSPTDPFRDWLIVIPQLMPVDEVKMYISTELCDKMFKPLPRNGKDN